jgi:7-carboxy-7-deazaguanine synthase
MKYRVAEIFLSINGEGPRAGELAVFVRFAGCNLQCTYCDTRWANEADVSCREMTGAELYKQILATGIKNVTLTGGEPLIQPGITALTDLLCQDPALSVEIETNGSVSLKPFCTEANRRPGFTMDYKLTSSGMEDKMVLANFEVLTCRDAVKFVVGDQSDLKRAREIINTYGLAEKTIVFISPVYAKIPPSEIVEFMIAYKMKGVRLQLQLHKVIWDPGKRGV